MAADKGDASRNRHSVLLQNRRLVAQQLYPPSYIGNRQFSCTTAGVGDCDAAVVPIGGEQQGRLSWTELQPQIELQQMND